MLKLQKKISKHWLKHRCVCKGRLGIRMQKVIVVSKTHLDLGFTDYAEHIYKKYLDEFIPSAVAIANELNADGTKRFVWTTGSWLLKEALQNGSEQNRQALRLQHTQSCSTPTRSITVSLS